MFINPYDEEPSQYLSFRAEVLFPVNNNRRAKVTIESLGLNREALTERRRDRLVVLKMLQTLSKLNLPESGEASRYLALVNQPEAEYSAMAEVALRP